MTCYYASKQQPFLKKCACNTQCSVSVLCKEKLLYVYTVIGCCKYRFLKMKVQPTLQLSHVKTLYFFLFDHLIEVLLLRLLYFLEQPQCSDFTFLEQQIAQSYKPPSLTFLLSVFTGNNEAYISQEDCHLTHLTIVQRQPADHSDAFFLPCYSLYKRIVSLK